MIRGIGLIYYVDLFSNFKRAQNSACLFEAEEEEGSPFFSYLDLVT